MKIFISMPMNGKSDKQVRREFVSHKTKLLKEYPEAEIINSIIDGFETSDPLKYLVKSLEMLSDADIVFFAKGWSEARGCKVEYHVSEAYGKAIKEEM